MQDRAVSHGLPLEGEVLPLVALDGGRHAEVTRRRRRARVLRRGRSRGEKTIASLAPGDAINGKNHVLLFASWRDAAKREANLIEEPKCGGHARRVTYRLNVGCAGSKGASIAGYSDCFIGLAHP